MLNFPPLEPESACIALGRDGAATPSRQEPLDRKNETVLTCAGSSREVGDIDHPRLPRPKQATHLRPSGYSRLLTRSRTAKTTVSASATFY
jgi:hypothetical protein